MFPELATALRVLTFRASSDELRALNRRHLAVGLFSTWLVGIGRWWEDPRVGLLQHLGIGSVIYVFALEYSFATQLCSDQCSVNESKIPPTTKLTQRTPRSSPAR